MLEPSFWLASFSMWFSYVPLVHSLYTCTALVWPMRWQRAIACTSFCGFQSGSKTMTVSAAVRLIPTPPARVDSMKMNESELGSEKRSIAWLGLGVGVRVRVRVRLGTALGLALGIGDGLGLGIGVGWCAPSAARCPRRSY